MIHEFLSTVDCSDPASRCGVHYLWSKYLAWLPGNQDAAGEEAHVRLRFTGCRLPGRPGRRHDVCGRNHVAEATEETAWILDRDRQRQAGPKQGTRLGRGEEDRVRGGLRLNPQSPEILSTAFGRQESSYPRHQRPGRHGQLHLHMAGFRSLWPRQTPFWSPKCHHHGRVRI